MNLGELLHEINRELPEPLGFPDAVAWINRGIDDLMANTKKEVMKTTAIVEANSYALPDDLHQISFMMVEDESEKRLEYVRLESRDETNRGYKLWGGTFSLQNGPETGTIELYYQQKVPHLSDYADEPAIEATYHDLLILYVLSRVKKDKDSYSLYDMRKNDYNAFITMKQGPSAFREVYF